MIQIFPHKTDCAYVGKISRPHGGEGYVLLSLYDISPNEFQEFEYVFLDIQEKLVPFFIQNCTVKSNSVYVQFDDIISVSQAEKICGFSMFVPKSFIGEEEEEPIHEFIGFKIFDGNQLLGEISNVIEYPMNSVFEVVDNKGNEILVPFAQQLIVEIKTKEKQIVMNLPEGLLELEN